MKVPAVKLENLRTALSDFVTDNKVTCKKNGDLDLASQLFNLVVDVVNKPLGRGRPPKVKAEVEVQSVSNEQNSGVTDVEVSA